MSETLRIKLGLKTHKGVLGKENEDRILIGMDPASNDWLYSPEEVATGDFGSVIVLADGIGQGQHGGKAAAIICQTVKKLFDETLEMPPDDEGILRLLQKFMVIANQQLILKGKEIPEIQHFACSATLVLLKEYKAYIIWAGNTRVYRYAVDGVKGTITENLPNLEQLNLDHTYEIAKELWGPDVLPKGKKLNELNRYFGMPHHLFETGALVCDVFQGEKLLICSEGIFESITVNQIQEILGQEMPPDLLCDELVTASFHAGSSKNISAVVLEIINGPLQGPVEIRSISAKIAQARKIVPARDLSKEEELLSLHPEQTKSQQHDETRQLKTIKVRTVLPEGVESPKPPEPTIKKSDPDDPIKTSQSDTGDKDQSSPYTSSAPPEGKSKPRIMGTAYPDPDDYLVPPKSEPILIEEKMEDPNHNSLAPDGPEDSIIPEDIQEEMEMHDEEVIQEEDTPQEKEITAPIAPSKIEKEQDIASEDFLEREDDGITTVPISQSKLEQEEIENIQANQEEQQKSTGKVDPKPERDLLPSQSKNIIRVGIILLAILIFGWILCNKNEEDSFEALGLERPKNQESKEKEKDTEKDLTAMPTPPPPKEEPPKEESKKPLEEQKADPSPAVEEKPVTQQKKEPNYDAQILANKQQLTDEIKALSRKKNELCRQINTYQKNAPAKKKEKIQNLNYDCDQLDKKFSSIYDPKTGFFLTERYDFLSSTIENIKFSINHTEKKFEDIRLEQ